MSNGITSEYNNLSKDPPNLSKVFLCTAQKWISENLIKNHNSFWKREVFSRIALLGLHFVSPCPVALDVAVGICIGIVTLLTGGQFNATYNIAFNLLNDSRYILVRIYGLFLKSINPYAIFRLLSPHCYATNLYPLKKLPKISGYGDGFFTHYALKFLTEKAELHASSFGNPFQKHVLSRLLYVALLISCLVLRPIDGVIGLIAAVASTLTLGKFESLNNLAYRGLQAPGIIKDLFYCIVKVINPWAGTELVSTQHQD